MAYLDVLPLATAKIYLRIDDTQNETDAEITSMIKSALSYIERHTHIMVYARNKDFIVTNGCAKVYDYPINSVVAPASSDDYSKVTKELYSNYTVSTSLTSITLNVGYADVGNVPTELIDLAKVMVKVMFYEQETNQTFKELLPSWAIETLNSNKRFIV